MNTKTQPIIFFDGVCGLCNGFVDFIMAIDKQKRFLFSPLQSDFAKNNLPAKLTQDLSSVVLLIDGQTYTKSKAVIKVMNEIGGIWKIALMGKIFPEAFLNSAYEMVAENRYRLFGKKETCRLPTEEERQRFVS
ncbi:MAG: DCC1-like thiol-disulfide oxidoreductase family protein [Bacteriovoracaceae bacterium]|nr:DCC1-like thiol-disulfide oxidoreductase family protein [Bacteriovoracaceae bacterium]